MLLKTSLSSYFPGVRKFFLSGSTVLEKRQWLTFIQTWEKNKLQAGALKFKIFFRSKTLQRISLNLCCDLENINTIFMSNLIFKRSM